MALSKTAHHIRSRVPEPAMRRFMRWMLVFCLGYATCYLAHDVLIDRHPVEVCK